jgi:transcription elongation factor
MSGMCRDAWRTVRRGATGTTTVVWLSVRMTPGWCSASDATASTPAQGLTVRSPLRAMPWVHTCGRPCRQC